jgi:hypothetical protein
LPRMTTMPSFAFSPLSFSSTASSSTMFKKTYPHISPSRRDWLGIVNGGVHRIRGGRQ